MRDRPFALRVAAMGYGLLIPFVLFVPALFFVAWFAYGCGQKPPPPAPDCRYSEEMCLAYAIEGCAIVEGILKIASLAAVLLVSLYLFVGVQCWRGQGGRLRVA